MDRSYLTTYLGSRPADESALDPNTSHAHILGMIEGAPRVVDFGCGDGMLARLLSQRGCNVVGVDINESHAVLAREYCSDVIVADLESTSLLSLFPSDRFDVAVFADVLEHLRNPEHVLKEVSRILRPGGYVLASVRNIAHGAIRLAMMEGRFEYQELGAPSAGPVRFFTHASAIAAFERSGLLVEAIETTTAPIFESTDAFVPRVDRKTFSEEMIKTVESDPDAQVLNIVVRAIPSAAADVRHRALHRRNDELRANLRSMASELHQLRRELEEKAGIPSAEHYEDVLARLHAATFECEELREQNARLAGSQGHENTEELLARNSALEAQLRDLYTQFEALAADRSAHALRADIAVEQVERLARDVARLQPDADRAAEAFEQRDRFAALVEHLSAEVERLRAIEIRVEGQQFDALRLQQELAVAEQRLNVSQARAMSTTTELETLRESYLHLREKFDGQVAASKDRAERVAELSVAVEALHHRCSEAERRADDLSRETTELVAKAAFYEHIIRAMRASKFWSIRNAWFRVKRSFGIETDIW